ncbi:MAG: ZIP family metal transporter [Candidatus Kerfeldbacteria bacterium]|nr:ZIP family metal transporter [Candidatus Kerfeldbacteria bacterium]
MDSVFLLALLASIISSLGGLAGGFLLLARRDMAKKLSHYLIGFAAGVLLSVSFNDLLPESLASAPTVERALGYILLGVIIFFLTERFIAFSHRHEADAEPEEGDAVDLQRVRPLVIAGDSLHNLIDGITVAITFVVSVPVGIATAVSVLLHEWPQEIADFSVLLRSGMAPRRVLAVNFWSSLVAPFGTVVGYLFATNITAIQVPLLGIATGNLLYLALADLIPHLHHERRPAQALVQSLLFLLGLSVFYFIPL